MFVRMKRGIADFTTAHAFADGTHVPHEAASAEALGMVIYHKKRDATASAASGLFSVNVRALFLVLAMRAGVV